MHTLFLLKLVISRAPLVGQEHCRENYLFLCRLCPLPIDNILVNLGEKNQTCSASGILGKFGMKFLRTHVKLVFGK